MTTIISVASSKGGTAKTTTACALASGLANLDSTLLVDLDNQGHVSLCYGLPVRSGLYDWLVRELPLHDCTLTGRPAGLTLLPGDSLTKTVERLYYAETNSFDRLVGALMSLPFEYVICDTNASGLLMEASLAAADLVVVPFLPETLALDSVHASRELVAQLNPHAEIMPLPVRYDTRLREHRLNLTSLREQLGDEHLQEMYAVPNRIAVAECPSYGLTVWEHNGRGIEAVRAAYSLLISRIVALANRDAVEQGEHSNGYSK